MKLETLASDLRHAIAGIATHPTEQALLSSALDALPVNDDDWGSVRQVRAENDFFEEINNMLSAQAVDELARYCLKATSEEMVFAGLQYIADPSKAA